MVEKYPSADPSPVDEVRAASAPDVPEVAEDAPWTDAPEAHDHEAHDHEAFVERMNAAFAATYSRAGLGVLVALTLFVGLGVTFFGLTALTAPLTWVLGLLVFLVATFVARIFVVRRAYELMAALSAYGAQHAVELHALRARYARAGAYTYFESIFQVLERRDALPDGATAPADSRPESGGASATDASETPR